MIDDTLIIDGVVHAFDFSDDNRAPGCDLRSYRGLQTFWHEVVHSALESPEPGYGMSLPEFTTRWHAEDLAHTFFVESDVDVVVAHSVHIGSFLRNGPSRWDVSRELARIAPGRVLLYAEADTFTGDMPRLLAHLEQRAAEGAVGIKLYPSNGMFDAQANKLVALFYDDPEGAYPIFEKARSLGIKHLAFHKAQPVGPGPSDVVKVGDISTAAAVFPDMTFEVVHTGWAFLEDSALQLMMHDNVYANLECTMGLVVRQPLRFAHILGTLLKAGGADRLLYASGCPLNHPDPILRAFLAFQIPEVLRDGYGYPELTPEIKRKILGGNTARLHDLDVAATRRRIDGDEWSRRRAEGKAEPWSSHRNRRDAEGRAS
jgi:predicted TIM-barrel fold metal-dependent hydrolase